MSPTDFEIIRNLAERLIAGHIENAASEARWMVELATRRASCMKDVLDGWVARRVSGEPFQYVVGSAEFYGLEFAVGPGVLIPRPETEVLVDHAVDFMNGVPGEGRVLDLCTGSGCIPLTLAHELPRHSYWGVDISPEALKWAQLNARTLAPRACQFLLGDLFSPVEDIGTFHMITANPPYIADEEFSDIPSEVKEYEPMLALRADEHGCAIATRIIRQAKAHLVPGGRFLMEIGETQGKVMLECLNVSGYKNPVILPDLTGRDRICAAFA